METKIKAIPTIYKGYRMRSRLEARWAAFFDALGIPWQYETEGLTLSDGTQYLPDFYLPDCKSWFEVKGVMSDTDLHKVTQLAADMRASTPNENEHVIIGYDDLHFEIVGGISDSHLVKCWSCGKYYFEDEGPYTCPCCGYYDGNSTFTPVLDADGDGWNNDSPEIPINKAKEAFRQFNHN